MSSDTVAAIARPTDAAKPARTKHGFSNNDEWRRLYFQSRRIAELHRLFRHRYRAEFYEFPEGDNSGWEDLVILLHHYCRQSTPAAFPYRSSKTRAPWIVGTEQEDNPIRPKCPSGRHQVPYRCRTSRDYELARKSSGSS